MPSRPGIMMSTMAASNGSARASSRPFASRRRQPHVVAFSSQQRLENLAHDLLVVDDEDRTFVGSSHLVRRAPRLDLLERQGQREPGALADRAVAADRPLMLAHDPVDDRQPEPRAAADRLRGEKRIVDARQLLGRDARTRVGDFGDRQRRRRSASRPTASRPSASRRARSGTGSGTPAGAGARCRAR